MGQSGPSKLEESRGTYSVRDITIDLEKSELAYIASIKFHEERDEYGRIILDASYKEIRRLFPSTLKGKHVQILKLNCNYLRTLPNKMKILKGLRELYLNENMFEFIPLHVCAIKNLQILNLSSNQLRSLPEAVGDIRNLEKLDVSYNKLNALPKTFTRLHKLKELYLDGNRFVGIPGAILSITSLKVLNLSRNNIKSLPSDLLQLENLSEFYVNDNFIEETPGSLEEYLQQLHVYEIFHNQSTRKLLEHVIFDNRRVESSLE